MSGSGLYNEITVFITAPNEEEAAKIASSIVEEKLAACVNIINSIRSIYRWQGRVEDDSEVLMIAKTRGALFDSLKKRVIELHSYDIPEIIALPIVDGSEEYLNWIKASTEKET
jgi:periplasmic divalent cation tolerance protein